MNFFKVADIALLLVGIQPPLEPRVRLSEPVPTLWTVAEGDPQEFSCAVRLPKFPECAGKCPCVPWLSLVCLQLLRRPQ